MSYILSRKRKARFPYTGLFVAVMMVACLNMSSLMAQTAELKAKEPPVQATARTIMIEVGKAISLPASPNTKTVFVSDSDIADAYITDENEIFVNGKIPGETTIFAVLGANQTKRQFNIIVTENISQIRRMIESRYPGTKITVDTQKGSIRIAGELEEERDRENMIASLSAAIPNVQIIDEIIVRSSNIVRLRVRLLEVNRQQANNYGIDWDATVSRNGFFIGASSGGVVRFGSSSRTGKDLNATIELLSSSGIVTVTQETLLSTVRGKPASFSVGGEIPIPGFIAPTQFQSFGNYQLDYMFIGTRLQFTPSVAPGRKLRLDIQSDIKSPQSSATTINGNSFPNLNSKSISTSVEVEDGQSFIIAGISRDDLVTTAQNAREGPFTRILDSIFGRESNTNSTQELVVLVTPILSDESMLEPGDLLPRRMSNLEFILTGGLQGDPKGALLLPQSISKAGFDY